MQKTYDAVIIGAGPAGISCAIWLKQFSLEPLLLEASDRVGGLSARNPFFDLWTPTAAGQTGIDIARGMASQLEASGAEVWLDSPVEKVVKRVNNNCESLSQTKRGNQFIISVRHQGQLIEVNAYFVVIASGVRARRLNASQDQSWPGVLTGPGEKVVQQDYTNLKVALLGGGDNAFENYDYIKSRGAHQLHIYARSVRAQNKFVARVPLSDVFVGPYTVEPNTKTVNGFAYDLIIVLYGWEAQAEFVEPLALERNHQNFIATAHATAQTSQQGIYAIGEVAQRMHPCVVTAFADGVVAAKAIQVQQAQLDGLVEL